LYRIYSTEEFAGKERPEAVVTEDSNAGYEFFRSIGSRNGISCASAKGKSNLKTAIGKLDRGMALVIADGAAGRIYAGFISEIQQE
jgi:hypothetical protein